MSEKIKIIRIVTRLNIGGISRHIFLLDSGLDPSLFDSVIVTGALSEGEASMFYLSNQSKTRIVYIPSLSRKINLKRDLISLWELYKIIRIHKPNIIETHASKAGVVGRISGFLAGVPNIIHVNHGNVFDGYFSSFKSFIFVGIERVLGYLTTRIIILSNCQYEDLCYRYKIAPPHKFEIINIGIDQSEFLNVKKDQRSLRGEFSTIEDNLFVGIIGRLSPVKNHRLFFESARIVLAKYVKVKFIVVGDGELGKELESFVIKLGIADHVIFLGWQEDLATIYAGLDIVALTSLNEGSPLTLIEAMASSTAVVATAVGGVRDTIIDGETGVLVPPSNAKAFSEAILGLLKNSEQRKRLGQNGQQYAKKFFSKKRMLTNYSRFYQKLVC